MKRVIIVHGWDGHPDECWFPWLKKELEGRGYSVDVPQLPQPDQPTIDNWVSALAQIAGVIDQETTFVGHSTGCAAILHLLERQPAGTKVGRVVLVGPWLTKLKTLHKETPDDQRLAQAWLDHQPNWTRIRSVVHRVVGIFSDNDQYVDLADADVLRQELKAKIVIEHNLGHMGPDVHCLQLPVALHAVLDITQS